MRSSWSSLMRLFTGRQAAYDPTPIRPRTHKARLNAKTRRKIAHESRRRNRAA